MKYYTEIVPFELAKKLKEAGYPQDNYSREYDESGVLYKLIVGRPFFVAPTYAEVFDWLIREGLSLEMEMEPNIKGWSCYICSAEGKRLKRAYFDFLSFHEAANAAIEKACELLKGQRL